MRIVKRILAAIVVIVVLLVVVAYLLPRTPSSRVGLGGRTPHSSSTNTFGPIVP
jgi:hypothetical protein